MTKNKKAIGVGIAAFVTGLNKLSNILYSGSDFLNPYIEKVDKIESNNRIEMDDDGYYSVIKGDDTPFKVMQITDLHIGGGYLSRHEDLKALSMVKSAINRVKPDIVVITGDLACSKAHLSFSRNNLNSFRIVTTMLENMGVPYAITFGNHDADKKTMFERRGLTDYLVSRKRSLFAITKETKVITGYSNYLVKLRNSDGKINSVLYMLDSNEYTHRHAIKTYDYIHDDQVTWYKESVDRLNKENGKLVPSHMFFHIPIIDRKYMNEVYNSCDVLFMPSYMELFPMTILEVANVHKPFLVRDLELYRPILFSKYAKANDVSGFSSELRKMKIDVFASVKNAELM